MRPRRSHPRRRVCDAFAVSFTPCVNADAGRLSQEWRFINGRKPGGPRAGEAGIAAQKGAGPRSATGPALGLVMLTRAHITFVFVDEEALSEAATRI